MPSGVASSSMDNLSNTEKLCIRSAATLVEIIGGQPLDRIKVNLQLPARDRVPFSTLLGRGIGEFYAASFTSVVQRCFFYIPAIYFGADAWNRYFKLENTPVLDGLAASCFASAIVTPGVSCFENLKLQQQINKKDNCNLRDTFRKTYATGGLRGLLPSIPSTFAREAAFALGMCYLSPCFYNIMKDNYNFDSVLVAGSLSGIVTQLITQPFDTIKTWQEKTGSTFVRSVQNMTQENGIKFLFSGSAPRVCRGMWTFSCLFYCTNEFRRIYEDNFISQTSVPDCTFKNSVTDVGRPVDAKIRPL